MVLQWDVGLAVGCNHTEGGVEHASPALPGRGIAGWMQKVLVFKREHKEG